MKMLVNAPSGMQELIEIGEGGGYFDQSRVLWDERADGSLPEITLGGMVRVGDGLEFDQTRMAEHVAAAAVPAVPYRVPMLNAHLVLIEAGWIDGINAYIDALPDDAPARQRSKARAYFSLALTMERNHPLVLGIPAALGKTETEVDDMFIAADALAV